MIESVEGVERYRKRRRRIIIQGYRNIDGSGQKEKKGSRKN